MKLKALTLLLSSTLFASVSHGDIILMDQSFTEEAGNQPSIDGTAVGNANTDVGVASTWAAGAAGAGALRTDGQVFSNLPSDSAYVGLGTLINDSKGTANGIFTLTTVMNLPGTGSNWVSSGFFRSPSVTESFVGAGGISTALYRTNGKVDFFAGPGTGGTPYADKTVSGTQTLISVLDVSTWNGTDDFGTVKFYLGSVAPENLEYTYSGFSADFSITAVGISTQSSGGEGVIQSITLTQAGTEPPTNAIGNIILMDQSFTEAGGNQPSINGTSVGNANTAAGVASTWTAGAAGAGALRTDGQVFTLASDSAYVDLGSLVNDAKGTANGIFTLTTVMNLPGGSNWVSSGFFNAANVTESFVNAGGLGTALYRTNGDLDFFYGNGTDLGSISDFAAPSPDPVTLISILDVSGWDGISNFGSVAFHVGAVDETPDGFYAFQSGDNVSFTSIAMGISTQSGGGEGVIQSITLTQTQIVSEGATTATYDGFTHYGTGTALDSFDSNGFGWTGGWYKDDLVTSPSTAIPQALKISAPEGYVALANQSVSAADTDLPGGLGRELNTPGKVDLSVDETVYFSLLVRRNAAQDQRFGLKASGSSHLAEVTLTTGNQLQVLLRNASGTNTSSLGGSLPAGDGDFLVIAKLSSSGSGDESLSAKVYDSATDTVPYYETTTWDATVTVELGTGQLDAAFFIPDARGSAPLSVESALMGEFRMAGDWRDVVGAPRRVVYPSNAGVLDVTAAPYNAAGDGVTDDTTAIQAAIHDALDNSENTGAEQIVYLPEGTYLVSDTLWGRLFNANPALGTPQFGLILQGESEKETIIQLADSTFTSAASPQAVIWYGANAVISGNSAFDNYLRDLTIDTGTGNPGAIGVDFLGNNNAGLRRVTIRSGDGQGVIGLDLHRTEQGPELISRVTVEGFDYGIKTESDRLQITFEDITLTNQSIAGIETESNTLAIRLLRSENTVPALRSTGPDSTISLREAWLDGGSGESALVTTARLYLRDVSASGYDRALNHNGINEPGLSISEFYSDAANTFISPPAHLGLLSRQHPEFFDSNLANWANVVSFGANPNDAIDDSIAIQAAIDSGKSILYFPTGTSSAAEYRANTPLFLRGNIRGVEGLFQTLAGFDGVFALEGPVSTLFTVEDGSGLPLFINDMTPRVTSIYFHWNIRHASSRDLVLTNTKNNYVNERDAGDLYAANVGGAPWNLQFPMKAWFRQLNPETFRGINVLNNGGDLWVHGMKTERTTTAVKTVGGGRSEVHGAFYLGQWPGAEDVPIFETIDSALSATFRSRGSGGNSFTTAAIEERSGSVDSITTASLPSSALFTSYPAGFTKPALPAVSVFASIPSAEEDSVSPVSGELTLRRTGDLSSSLNVDLVYTGDAVSGTDYAALPVSAIFPASVGEVPLSLDPLNDADREGTEDVIASVVPDAGYVIGWPASAAVNILDDDLPPAAFNTANLAVWLREDFQRAADGRVYRWFDASGNGNDAYVYSPIGNQRAPEWNPYAFGSRGGAACDVDFFTFYRSSTIADSGYSQRTLCMVLQTGSDVTSKQVLYQQGDSSSGLSLYLEGGDLYFAVWPNGTVTTVSLPVSTIDNLLITAAVDTATPSIELTINGSSTTVSLPSSNSFDSSVETASLGALYQTTRFPSGAETGYGEFPLRGGLIGEFLIFNAVLALSDEADVLAYLEERLTTGFAAWQLAEFAATPDGPSSAAADIFADPEGDGIENIDEYALGLDPLAASNADVLFQSFTSDGGDTYLTLQVPRTAIRSDLSYAVEVSFDLNTWSTGPGHTVTLQDIATLLEVRSASTMEDEPRQFLRLKVQR